MRKQLKPIPEFRSEDEERDFWGAKGRDSTEYIDWSKARLARFPNIKLSTRSISLRLPVSLLERIKLEANKRDVPYQSLIKMWLAEKAWPTQPDDQAGHPRLKGRPMTNAAQAKRRSSSTKGIAR